MQGFGTKTTPGCKYVLNASSFGGDTAIFFGTFTGTHSGPGGPVEPTNKTTNSEYVYVVKFEDKPDGKIVGMTKVWNAPWAMRELGWC